MKIFKQANEVGCVKKFVHNSIFQILPRTLRQYYLNSIEDKYGFYYANSLMEKYAMIFYIEKTKKISRTPFDKRNGIYKAFELDINGYPSIVGRK